GVPRPSLGGYVTGTGATSGGDRLRRAFMLPILGSRRLSRTSMLYSTESVSSTKGRITMHHFFFIAALFALTATSSVALAQVPPDIAEGIRKIGPINDPPGTAKLYAPLFANQKEHYPNVTVVRDIASGMDPIQKIDDLSQAQHPGATKHVVNI